MPDAVSLADDSLLPHPNPSAIYKALEEGGVLLSTANEVYFGVNEVGGRIWSLLPPTTRTFGELCGVLERQYPDADAVRIRADAQEFLAALVANKLVMKPPV